MTELYEVADAQRDDVSLSAADLISAYEWGVADLHAALSGMTDDELRRRPVPGKWNTLEVVCHVSDCEQFFADRMKRTLAMDRPLVVTVPKGIWPTIMVAEKPRVFPGVNGLSY